MSTPGRPVCDIRCSGDHGGRQRTCGALWGIVYATHKGYQVQTGMRFTMRGADLAESKASTGYQEAPKVTRLTLPLGRGAGDIILIGPCGRATVGDEEVLAHVQRYGRAARVAPMMVPPGAEHSV